MENVPFEAVVNFAPRRSDQLCPDRLECARQTPPVRGCCDLFELDADLTATAFRQGSQECRRGAVSKECKRRPQSVPPDEPANGGLGPHPPARLESVPRRTRQSPRGLDRLGDGRDREAAAEQVGGG